MGIVNGRTGDGFFRLVDPRVLQERAAPPERLYAARQQERREKELEQQRAAFSWRGAFDQTADPLLAMQALLNAPRGVVPEEAAPFYDSTTGLFRWPVMRGGK